MIQQCQTTSQDMKQQQWELDLQFGGLDQWRKDVEEEFKREKGHQQILSERVSLSNMAAKGDVAQLKRELSEMRGRNRNRTEPGHGFVHGSTTQLFDGAKTESHVPHASAPGKMSRDAPKRSFDFEQHAPTREQHAPTRYEHDPTLERVNESPNNGSPPGLPTTSTYFGQIPTNNNANRNTTQRLLPNGMIDACPGFAANLFQNWRREVKLRSQSQVGANPTQLIAKMVSTLPMNSRMEVLSYLETTENQPHLRTAGHVMEMANRRFWEN